MWKNRISEYSTTLQCHHRHLPCLCLTMQSRTRRGFAFVGVPTKTLEGEEKANPELMLWATTIKVPRDLIVVAIVEECGRENYKIWKRWLWLSFCEPQSWKWDLDDEDLCRFRENIRVKSKRNYVGFRLRRQFQKKRPLVWQKVTIWGGLITRLWRTTVVKKIVIGYLFWVESKESKTKKKIPQKS